MPWVQVTQEQEGSVQFGCPSRFLPHQYVSPLLPRTGEADGLPVSAGTPSRGSIQARGTEAVCVCVCACAHAVRGGEGGGSTLRGLKTQAGT